MSILIIRSHLCKLLLFASVLFFSGCSSYKQVPYLQEASASSEATYPSGSRNSVVRFSPDDVLTITVNASGQPSVAADFNLPLQPAATPENSDEGFVSQGIGRQSYLVNKDGFIDFPVLGAVKAAGLTCQELEGELKNALREYIKTDPVVTIRLTNYRISVLGEVNRPGQFTVSKDRINVLEALSLAGDMTIYGKREVRIMREMPDGNIQIARLDISDASAVSSPYFYLQQNDVLYVEPNKARTRSSDIGSHTGILISIGSVLLTVVNLVVVIAK